MLRERRRHANFKPNRRLDRKSSRGMIYENEELRLRTININAEVERGQSDIRKLRRENEQLRREIWSLRDEYDRLNKLLRANRSTESCSGGGGGGGRDGENNGNNSCTQDEDSDSCDTCKEDDGEDDVCDEMQCGIHNKIKCRSCSDTDYQDCHSNHQHQNSSSSCGSDTKKKTPTTSSSLQTATTISSPSSISNNGGGSREITENYENSQKSQVTENISGSSGCKNCSNTSCSGSSSNNTSATGGAGVGDSCSNIKSSSNKAYNASQNTEDYISNHHASNATGIGGTVNTINNTNNNEGSVCGGNSNSGDVNDDKLRENLHVNFDHLSVVSEENLTNSDGNSVQQNDLIDQSATATSNFDTNNKRLNRISDIESLVPPLSHFENISYEEIGPSLADLEDVNYSRSTTSTGDTVIAANGWDFPSETTKMNTSARIIQDNDDVSNIIHSNSSCTNETATSSSSPLSPFKISEHLLDTKIPSSSLLSTDRNRSPKHFFSPLKPKVHPDLGYPSSPSSSLLPINAFQTQQQQQHQKQYNQNYNGPDVFVANALASSSSSSYHSSPKKSNIQSEVEPVYASVQKPPSKVLNESSFQTGGNLEDLLMDIETLSKDILQMQLQKQKSLSEDKLDNGDDTTEAGCLSNRKPFRSEMNLVLTYNGTNPVITPIMKSSTSTSLNCGIGMGCTGAGTGGIGGNISVSGDVLDEKNFSTATTMERGSVRETPPLPKVPEPMTLFPDNRPYLGFENFGQPPISSLANGRPILSTFGKSAHDKLPSSSSSDTQAVNTTMATTDGNGKPSLTLHSPNDFNQNFMNETTTVITKTPNKLHLLDKKNNQMKDVKKGNFALETANCDSSSGSESTIKRKSRRVSILFRKSEEKGSKKNTEKNQKECKSEVPTATVSSPTTATTTTTATDTTTEVLSEQIGIVASNIETPQITSNNQNNVQESPHSDQHRSNSSSVSAHHHHHHRHGHHHHHHHKPQENRKMSQDSGSTKHLSKLVSSSVTSVGHNTSNTFEQDHNQHSQSDRRHSEGTVLATISGGCANDVSGGPGVIVGDASPSHHQHHHHHHHSHTGVTNTGGGGHHHHHHTRHDSYNDGGGGGTSMSERNSNSLASSRESSTSLSTRSHRRKISISSHSGGKIPWCGCWGNGCL